MSVTGDQVVKLQRIARTYAPDMDQPAALEVLLVLQEVYEILDLPKDSECLFFGRETLRRLKDWGRKPLDEHPAPPQPAGSPHRAWVWLPGRAAPAPAVICTDGSIRLADASLAEVSTADARRAEAVLSKAVPQAAAGEQP